MRPGTRHLPRGPPSPSRSSRAIDCDCPRSPRRAARAPRRLAKPPNVVCGSCRGRNVTPPLTSARESSMSCSVPGRPVRRGRCSRPRSHRTCAVGVEQHDGGRAEDPQPSHQVHVLLGGQLDVHDAGLARRDVGQDAAHVRARAAAGRRELHERGPLAQVTPQVGGVEHRRTAVDRLPEAPVPQAQQPPRDARGGEQSQDRHGTVGHVADGPADGRGRSKRVHRSPSGVGTRAPSARGHRARSSRRLRATARRDGTAPSAHARHVVPPHVPWRSLTRPRPTSSL